KKEEKVVLCLSAKAVNSAIAQWFKRWYRDGTTRFFKTTTLLSLRHVIYSFYLCYVLSLYPFTERYAQPYSFHVLYGRGVTFMVSEPGFETVGSKDLTCEDWMVNTRIDADLSAAVQNALQTLLPQIRTEIHEEFRTSFGLSDAGGNPPPTTIHTWLERFNKKKPHSFEKATAPMDAENWISHMEKIFDVMGCEDAFKTRLAVYKFEGNALAWWKAYKQAKGGDAWLITVANATRNYEILH
nr:zinc finger, CCHC-type, retrotransposon Gag domain protein [Tanacetum cinerariifolium]